VSEQLWWVTLAHIHIHTQIERDDVSI